MSKSISLGGLTGKLSREDRSGSWKRGPLVAVTWDQQYLSYVVVSAARQKLRVLRHGSVPHEGDELPLEELRRQLDAAGQRVEKLVLVVPRAQLEMLSVEVPQADANELAALVQSEVDAQLGDGEQALVADFCVLEGHPGSRSPWGTSQASNGTSESGNGSLPEEESGQRVQTVAFAVEQARFAKWQSLAETHGFGLTAVTSRQVAPLTSLITEGEFRRRLTVLVAIYAGEVELSFIEGKRLALLRTFRVASNTPESLAEQIQIEVQRSLSMVDFGAASQDAELLLLQRDPALVLGSGLADDESGETASASSGASPTSAWDEFIDGLDARAVRLDPESWEGGAGEVIEPALVGAVMDLSADRLAVDLIHPKRPAASPNPVKRWSLIGGLAAVSLGVVGYVLWSDVSELRRQVDAAEEQLEKEEAIAAKMQEQGDETRYVQQWLGTQVDWLTHMQRLSQQFPDGQGANVRRLSASIEDGLGVFDLSLQVSDPSRVATLENRLRAAGFVVTSEQISEQSANAEYPWQFEATVAFPLVPLEEREEGLELVELVSGASSTEETDTTGEAAAEADETGAAAANSEASEQPPGSDDESTEVGAAGEEAAGDEAGATSEAGESA